MTAPATGTGPPVGTESVRTTGSARRRSRRGGRYPPTLPNLWLIYLVVGSLAVVAYYLVPDGIAAAIYQLVGLSAAAAIVVGVRLHQPARRSAWYLMALGLWIWSLADGIGNWWALVLDRDVYPTPADAVYLIGYVAVALGILLLVRGRHQGHDLAGTLDSLILTTSLAVLSWVLLARPIIGTYQDSPIAAVVAVSYPIADIVLAGLLIRLLTTQSGRTRSYRLLVLALILLILADTASSALSLLTFEASEPLDFLWLASYLAWGAAALEPSIVSLSAPTVSGTTTFTRARLAALTVAVLIPPVALGVQTALGLTPTVWAVVVFSVIAVLLVVARMNLSIEQIQAANADVAAVQAELSHLAAHDSLTGLANRAQAMRLISGTLSRAQRSGAVVGLLVVDLDDFKQVNDTLGHQAGDEVLLTVAQRIVRTVRAGDVVARLGGDEFLVLLEPLDEQASGVAVAERVIAVVTQPMRLRSGHHARIGASVGLAISQDAGTDADSLLQEADLAVYRAKSAGRGRIEVFDRSLRDRLSRRSQIEDSVRAALGDGSVDVSLEPIVELITGELAGLEIRGNCRIEGNLVDRAELIADLGRSPAILELDAWLLRRAAATAAGIRGRAATLPITVAVSAQHLLQDRILGDVADALSATGVAADRLVLMISAAEVTDDLRLLSNLDTLRERGVRVWLDGFGAGAAPTNQLLQLPVSAVRLDPTLISRPAPSSAPATADGSPGTSRAEAGTAPQMLRLTVQTARASGYGVIAPHLADAEALSAATAAGCEFGQGLAARDLLQDDAVLAMRLSRGSSL
jgi:diguanylate cyclase (GGDEF)-like protein